MENEIEMKKNIIYILIVYMYVYILKFQKNEIMLEYLKYTKNKLQNALKHIVILIIYKPQFINIKSSLIKC